MGANTNIEWCDHTFSPWWGCAEVSPACDHCYARAWAKRVGLPDLWGPNAKRRFFSDAHWRNPLKWNRRAAAAGERHRVFCASMADVLDNHPAVIDARSRLWPLIRETPHLDWLLLTKRIGNAPDMLPIDWGDGGYRNVWLGITVANQDEANRDVPKLLRVPARVRFLSCEPLLGPIDLRALFHRCPTHDYAGGFCIQDCGNWQRLHWVIAGGESGPKARPFVLGHAKDIVRQCHAAGVRVFLKQAGSNPVNREGERCPHIKHPKGADMAEWPEELRVREFPRSAA